MRTKFLQVKQLAFADPNRSRWSYQRLDISAALQESDSFVRGSIYRVIILIAMGIKQAMVKEGVEVKIHLLGA
jgi:hypothetical protein